MPSTSTAGPNAPSATTASTRALRCDDGLGVIGAVREPDGNIVVAGTRRPRRYGEELELLRFR